MIEPKFKRGELVIANIPGSEIHNGIGRISRVMNVDDVFFFYEITQLFSGSDFTVWETSEDELIPLNHWLIYRMQEGAIVDCKIVKKEREAVVDETNARGIDGEWMTPSHYQVRVNDAANMVYGAVYLTGPDNADDLLFVGHKVDIIAGNMANRTHGYYETTQHGKLVSVEIYTQIRNLYYRGHSNGWVDKITPSYSKEYTATGMTVLYAYAKVLVKLLKEG